MKEKELDFNGHEYVDLGLPSGTLWAKKNVGADNETDYGLYFAWGETEGYTGDSKFKWDDYKYFDKTPELALNKYNDTDEKTILDLDDDAAHVNMGGDWRMPSAEDIDELLTNTTFEVIEKNGVNGLQIKSNINDNTLFIPFGGYSHCSDTIQNYDTISYINERSYLWSCTLKEKEKNDIKVDENELLIDIVRHEFYAYLLYTVKDESCILCDHRNIRMPVRGVINNNISKQNNNQKMNRKKYDDYYDLIDRTSKGLKDSLIIKEKITWEDCIESFNKGVMLAFMMDGTFNSRIISKTNKDLINKMSKEYIIERLKYDANHDSLLRAFEYVNKIEDKPFDEYGLFNFSDDDYNDEEVKKLKRIRSILKNRHKYTYRGVVINNIHNEHQFFIQIDDGLNGSGDFVYNDMSNVFFTLLMLKNKNLVKWISLTDVFVDILDDLTAWTVTFTI